jgi:hypothetical protein
MGSSALRPRRSRSLRTGALAGLVGLLLLSLAPGAHAAVSCTQNLGPDAQGFRWDLTAANLSDTWDVTQTGGGFVTDGGYNNIPPGRSLTQSEAYDGWGVLKFDNTGTGGAGSFDYYSPPDPNGCDFDPDSGGRELAYPPMTFENLEVSRKIYVPSPSSGIGFVRYLDLVKNVGSDTTVSVSFEGDLGSDLATRVRATSNGDLAIALPDRWGTTDTDTSSPGYDPSDSVDPPIAHVWDGPGATEPGLLSVSDLNQGNSPVQPGWTTNRPLRAVYGPTSIQAGQTLAFMHFEAQRSTAEGALAVAQSLGDAKGNGEGFAFLDESELALLKNWDPSDLDGDSVASPSDNCRFVTNADQANADGDSAGNACDDDDDNDGLSDATEAALGTNPLSSDSDGDGKPDPADSCPLVAGTGSNGCPVAPPPPPGVKDTTPPRVTLIVQSKVKLKNFKRGLTAAARVNEPASMKFELLGAPAPKRKARTRAKAFTRVLARQSLAMAGAGLRAARLRPSKKLLGKARKFVVQLRVTAVDRAGNRTIVTRRINVR